MEDLKEFGHALAFILFAVMWVVGTFTACFTFINGITIGPNKTIWLGLTILIISQTYGYIAIRLIRKA